MGALVQPRSLSAGQPLVHHRATRRWATAGAPGKPGWPSTKPLAHQHAHQPAASPQVHLSPALLPHPPPLCHRCPGRRNPPTPTPAPLLTAEDAPGERPGASQRGGRQHGHQQGHQPLPLPLPQTTPQPQPPAGPHAGGARREPLPSGQPDPKPAAAATATTAHGRRGRGGRDLSLPLRGAGPGGRPAPPPTAPCPCRGERGGFWGGRPARCRPGGVDLGDVGGCVGVPGRNALLAA